MIDRNEAVLTTHEGYAWDTCDQIQHQLDRVRAQLASHRARAHDVGPVIEAVGRLMADVTRVECDR